ARLDLVVSWPGLLALLWASATARSPRESGWALRAIGHEARDAEKRMKDRYREVVVPLAVETEGGSGPAAQRLVADIAAQAQRIAVFPGEDFAQQVSARAPAALASRRGELVLAAAQDADAG
ncbi:unnamed protein product, partial [Prorocentrum cordatum]